MQEINSLEVQNFLDYFELNTEVSFELEESKKSELFAVAKAKGIIAENSKDLALFSGILEILDKPNGNKKILPKEEALKKLPQLCGKPLNLNHLRTMVVGAIIDYRYIEKENKVIIFGCIYKSIFPAEYKKMQEAFKNKHLALSSEIWAPKNLRKYNSDGTFELTSIEFAGAAIIIMDKKTQPAELQDKILELSMKEYEEKENLIFSNLNKEVLPIYKCDDCSCGGDCGVGCHNMIFSSLEQPMSTQPSKLKVICSHCSHNFEYLFVPNQTSSIKCPQCRSILNQQGEMLYPPQDLNFSLSCPNDSANNWLIVSSDDNSAKVRCQSCGKEYDLTFKQMPEDMKVMLSKIQFLHSGSAPCWQCGHYNNYNSLSNQEKVNLHCSKCGLDYVAKPYIKLKRDILKVEESGIKKDEPKDKGEKNLSPSLELIMAELDSRNNK
jgi:DNA-directed RNA polymerase subunit RPC12/RpoP/DNA-directed RNA polymerase subunit M/transcription elongation factor TFIIS